jgi:regulator of RNase E activity RraB
LTITRDQSVTSEKINEAVLELFRMAREVDAEYDGWEAQLIATKN